MQRYLLEESLKIAFLYQLLLLSHSDPHLVWIPGCYFSPNHRSPLSHHLKTWPLFQNLDSDVGFTAHEWSLSSCEVWKWPKWPSSDTCGTEWQLWGPLDQTPNTQGSPDIAPCFPVVPLLSFLSWFFCYKDLISQNPPYSLFIDR